jgi:hypothetical protein
MSLRAVGWDEQRSNLIAMQNDELLRRPSALTRFAPRNDIILIFSCNNPPRSAVKLNKNAWSHSLLSRISDGNMLSAQK